jgi:alanyl-tRNA synthetase
MTMSRNSVKTLVVTLALVAVVWYHRRREQALREGLTRSRQWAASIEDGHTPDPATATDRSVVERVATRLNVRPEEVPDHVEALDERARRLTNTMEAERSQWATRWWDARTAERPATDQPHVTLVDLPDGTLADAEAIARHAPADALAVRIVAACGDGAVAVTVGSDLDQRADDLAREIAAMADGSATGGPEFATGDGEPGALSDAAARVRDRLQSEAGFAV